MADYSNAKVGDSVRIITYFSVIEDDVIKVTKAQVHTQRGKYRRSDGAAIGNSRGLRILKDGEKW